MFFFVLFPKSNFASFLAHLRSWAGVWMVHKDILLLAFHKKSRPLCINCKYIYICPPRSPRYMRDGIVHI